MMNKQQVKRIEARAKSIMDKMWEEMNGWVPISKRYKQRTSILYYYILEDANFHQEIEQMTRKGLFGPFTQNTYDDGTVISTPKSYGSPQAERLWKEYQAAGGHGYQIWD